MKIVCLALGLALYSLVPAQTPAAPKLPTKLVRISTPKMAVNEEDSNVIFLKMEFNGAVPKSRLSKIKVDEIASVTLAYSRYRLSEMFDQLTLNAQRMDKLYGLMPGLKENKKIQWYWVEQTGCEDPEACGDYFHGFVITLKSASALFSRESEIALMEYYTSVYEGEGDTRKMDSLMAGGKLRMVKTCDTVTMTVLNKRNRMARIKGWDLNNKHKLARYLRQELGDSGTYNLELIMDSKGKLEFASGVEQPAKAHKILKLLNEDLRLTPARYNGKRISSEVFIGISAYNKDVKINTMQNPILPAGENFSLDNFLYTVTTEVRCDYTDTSSGAKAKLSNPLTSPDIIFKVFDRNKQWKNCLIATDVTGSMYPYLAQFRVWHKLHLSLNAGNHDFVFFNDGDNAPDHTKVAGKVGGIYYVKTIEFEDLSKTMTNAMYNGGGGDGPENNIEAVIEGLKKNPGITEVIMIADNWATPRDLNLLSKINVPIRLILCGAQTGINTAYLDMIRKNRGSIHTMENDLYNLAGLMEGQKIELDGIEYELKGGKFVMKPVVSQPATTRTVVLLEKK